MAHRPKTIVLAATLVAALVWSVASSRGAVSAQTRGGAAAPAFAADPLWPKPLPNHWILGSVTSVFVDSRDHVWIVHRGQDSLNARTESALKATPPGSEYCCQAAPAVLEFDPTGALVSSWGAPGTGYEWPQSPGGITVDGKGDVWIAAAGAPDAFPAPAAPPATGGGGAATAGAGNRAGGTGGRAGGGAPAAAPRPGDSHILKFSATGKFLLQIGKAGQMGTMDSTDMLNKPADMAVDMTTNEVFVADGGATPRVVVFDATTGAHKRHWGGHGGDFGRLTSIAVSKDGNVYAGDRKNNRVQVFKKDGTWVKDIVVSKATGGFGSVWDVALSADAAQQYLFVADGQDEKIFVINRATGAEVTSFGDGGRWPGTFRAVGSVGSDSKGNLYTGETFEGKRVQRFVKK